MAKKFQRSPASKIPPVPMTSRFVAPWDTAGWYYMLPELYIGCDMYSNCDDKLLEIDEKYLGADYVVSFNSIADGFDDKEELEFFAERDVTVYAALDKKAIPEFVKDWADTGDTLKSDKGAEYEIFSKDYKKTEHVKVPGFKGDCNHFFVFVLPKDDEYIERDFPVSVISDKLPEAYKKRTYKNYITDVFNGESLCSCYETEGEVKLVAREEEARDKYLSLNNASVKRSFEGTDRIVATAKINVAEGGKAIFTLENEAKLIDVTFKGGKITASGEDVIDYKENTDVALRLVYNGEKGSADIFVNCRKAKTVKAEKGEVKSFKFVSIEKEAQLDNLTITDDTEIFVVNDNFESEASRYLAYTENALVETTAYPFKDSVAYKLTSKDEKPASFAYAFPSVEGLVSVESLLITDSEEFSLAPMLTDKNGTPAMRIALYQNNLYATDGDEFVRIYGGTTNFQYYPCKNVINIKVTVDTNKGTYDLMVDGSYRAKGYKLLNPVSEICNAVYTANKEALTLMRVRVYDDADLARDVIPNAPVFDVTKEPYNAVADGVTFVRKNIQKAIDDAAFTGGTVYLPEGVYYTGELILRNDMTLWVSKNAKVFGTHDHSEYTLRSPGDSRCGYFSLGRGFIYGENVSNVRVTGGGVIDGNGKYRFKMNDPHPDRRLEEARPDIFLIEYSKDVTLEHINLKSPGFWTVVPLGCDHVFIRYLNLDSLNTPNRDGINPVDCSDLTIYSCNIIAGDDGITFKSSEPHGCENIDVHDIVIQSLASGIKFGTDTYWSFKNAHIKELYIKNVNRCGISLESVDGAEVENIVFEKINMTDVGAPAYICVGDRKRLPRNGHPPRLGYIKGVTFDSLRFERPYPFSFTKDIREVLVIGQYDHARVEDVTFKNCYFALPGGFNVIPPEPRRLDDGYPEYDKHGLSAGSVFTVKWAKNFKIENCEFTLEKKDYRPKIAYFEYKK
ncbi:MAG: hypothetical protein E7564_09270 [Ruminococcaceae bacterium]|nr:hypothetical protein [Oscillospiraceae bacterium]